MIQKGKLQFAAMALMLALVGCGGGKGADPAKPEPSAQEKLESLETSGAIPQLERLPTIEGIDINGDGVRDDIEQYIEQKYTDPAQRKAAMQTARAFQAMLLVDKNDAMALERVSEMGGRALNCRSAVFPGVQGIKAWSDMSSELEAMTTNTKERLLAYLAYNKARSGSVSRLPEGDTCE